MIIKNFINMLIFLENKNKSKKIIYKNLNPKEMKKNDLNDLNGLSGFKIFIIRKNFNKEISSDEFLKLNLKSNFLFINNTY